MPRKQPDDVEISTKPDLSRMKSIFLRDLMPSSEKAAKIRGDQSAAWKTIEDDCHCNKRAAKQLLKLMNESEETRDDFLRTFLPGLKELNLVPQADLAGEGLDDLVDEMEAGITAGNRPMGTEGMPALQ